MFAGSVLIVLGQTWTNCVRITGAKSLRELGFYKMYKQIRFYKILNVYGFGVAYIIYENVIA
jgi:hypothetical protein